MDDLKESAVVRDVSLELLRYYDNFAVFNEECAFLCEAFASLAANSESMDEYSIRGLERHAYWLKGRVFELKANLKQIRKHHAQLSGKNN